MPVDNNMEQQPKPSKLKTQTNNSNPPPPPHFEMLSLSEFVMETKRTQKYAFSSLYGFVWFKKKTFTC